MISTHVLDTARGRPASDVHVTLHRRDADGWELLAEARTDDDGRVAELLADGHVLAAGVHRLRFDTGAYLGGEGFYPEVAIVFSVRDASEHHHVPLLLSPYGYSTYRGT
ncbi:hydroxyisourate hydrolase [soil metagenome]